MWRISRASGPSGPARRLGISSDLANGFVQRVGVGLAAWNGGVSLATLRLLLFFHRTLPSWLCTEERTAPEIVPADDETAPFYRVTVNDKRRMNPAKEGGLEESPSGRSVKARE